jgi:ABC-type glutathione transport system ATPase component
MARLLEVTGLDVVYGRGRKAITALQGAALGLDRGEILAVVGESGSGKSSLARAVAGLVAPASGRVVLDGTDLTALKGRTGAIQRRGVQMVFQDPDASLNPRHTVATILDEPLAVIGFGDAAARRARVAELLGLVHLDPVLLERRPGALSGGQKQRVAIARALAMQPKLLIADEALSALDVSTQSRIAGLFADIRDRLGLGVLFITHDMRMVERLADSVCVINAGQVVEYGPADEVMTRPQNPYTRLLLAAALDPAGALADPRRLEALAAGAPLEEVVPA